MCGIAGIFRWGDQPSINFRSREVMDVLAHRGPDGKGIYEDGPVTLVHRRLAIIDLSERGRQPMANENKMVWLIFNGEIYNFKDLRPTLEEKGHWFRSQTDCEVVLHGFEEEGINCTKRYNGMWAFAIYDRPNRRLFLSRDRLGIKPLYYATYSWGLIFASEIKALLICDPDLREPDDSELINFLSTGYIENDDGTFFRRIKVFPPGHNMTINMERNIQLKGFWHPPEPKSVSKRSYFENCEEFRELLKDSVRLRLRSDVPVGTCLSGGVDSTSIVALESEIANHKIHTFSVIYPHPDFSEGKFVDEVVRVFNTEAHRSNPNPDLISTLDSIVWYMECPLHGPGPYSQWKVMELAKGKVKVLLDGQGPDELLGGYSYFFPGYYADIFSDIVRGKIGAIEEFLISLPAIARRTSLRGTLGAVKAGIKMFFGNEFPLGTCGPWSDVFLKKDFRNRGINGCRNGEPKEGSFLTRSLYHSVLKSNLPMLLHYEDRSSMAHSIEARTPFLDYRVVEFCLQIPYDMRIRRGVTKAILRDAMEKHLPNGIKNRIDKKGYPTPVREWFRGPELENLKEILLSSTTLKRGIFRLEAVSDVIKKHVEGCADFTVPLYRMLTMEIWFRKFFDDFPK